MKPTDQNKLRPSGEDKKKPEPETRPPDKPEKPPHFAGGDALRLVDEIVSLAFPAGWFFKSPARDVQRLAWFWDKAAPAWLRNPNIDIRRLSRWEGSGDVSIEIEHPKLSGLIRVDVAI